jgi:hypothetical protein
LTDLLTDGHTDGLQNEPFARRLREIKTENFPLTSSQVDGYSFEVSITVLQIEKALSFDYSLSL